MMPINGYGKNGRTEVHDSISFIFFIFLKFPMIKQNNN